MEERIRKLELLSTLRLNRIELLEARITHLQRITIRTAERLLKVEPWEEGA